MNIRDVEVFRAVMHSGSVAAAARLLAVSPPAISRKLRHTEDRLGYRLFERRAGRLFPTPEAEILYAEADKALRGVQRVSDLAEALGRGSDEPLRLAANPSFGAGLLPQISLTLSARRFRARLDIFTTGHHAVVERVALRQADLGLTQFEPEHPLLQKELLGRFRMCVALAPSSYLADRPVVALRDLCAVPVIGYEQASPIGGLVEAFLLQQGVALPPIITVRFPMIACMFVNAGVGAAIVDPFVAVAPACWQIVFRPLDPAPETEVWLVRHGSRALSNSGRLFAQAVRDALQTTPISLLSPQPVGTAVHPAAR